jgi:ferredoxin, 2Fe-2S
MQRFGASGYTYNYRANPAVADWSWSRIIQKDCQSQAGEHAQNDYALIVTPHLRRHPSSACRLKSPGQPMPEIIVTSRTGEQTRIEVQVGLSVMEVIRDAGYNEAFALCGGACSCATCHVYIDPAFADQLPVITEGESELLDGSDHRQATSRLSCQVPFEQALDGLRVRIAPEA